MAEHNFLVKQSEESQTSDLQNDSPLVNGFFVPFDQIADDESQIASDAFLSTVDLEDGPEAEYERSLTEDSMRRHGVLEHQRTLGAQYLANESLAVNDAAKNLLNEADRENLPAVFEEVQKVSSELAERTERVQFDDLEARQAAMEAYINKLRDKKALLAGQVQLTDDLSLLETETIAVESAIAQDISSQISEADWLELTADGADWIARNVLPGPPTAALELFEKLVNDKIGDGKNRSFSELTEMYLSASPSEKIQMYKYAKEAAELAYVSSPSVVTSPITGTKVNKLYSTMALLGFVGLDRDFVKWELGSDAISGVAFFGPYLAGLASLIYVPKKIRNVSKALMLAKAARAEDAVSELIFKASVGDPEAVEKVVRYLGMTPEEVALSVHPLKTDETIEGMALRDDSAQLMRASLRADQTMQAQSDEIIRQVREGSFGTNLFSEQARQQALLEAERIMEETGVIAKEVGEEVHNLQVIDSTEDTITFGYTSAKEGKLAQKTHTIDYTYDLETGTWKFSGSKVDQVLPTISTYLKSPSELFRNEGIVDRATQADNQYAILVHKLDVLKAQTDLVGPKGKRLGFKSRRKVDKVLHQGSLDSKQYTATELVDGIPTESGIVKLNVDEIESYFKKRKFFNTLGDLEDLRAYTEASRQGLKTIDIAGLPPVALTLEGKSWKTKAGALQAIARNLSTDKKTVRVSDLTDDMRNLVQRDEQGRYIVQLPKEARKQELGKVFESTESAAEAVAGARFRDLKTGQTKSGTVWDPLLNKGQGNLTKLPSKNVIEQRYNEGWKLAKVRYSGGEIGKGKVANFVWVRKDNVHDLPFNMIRRPEGYVPRIYKDNVVFVKTIDEEGNPVRTVHTFSNIEAARRYAKARNGDKGIKYQVFRNDQLREEDTLSAIIDRSGNLFTGTRKTRLVPHDDNAGVHPIQPPKVAIQRAIDHAAKGITKASLVQAMKKRWLNQLAVVAKAQGKPNKGLSNMSDFYSDLTLDMKTPEAQQLLRARKYIKQVQNLPTSSVFDWQRILFPIQAQLDKTVLDGLRVVGINVPLSKTLSKGGSVLLNHLSTASPAALVKGLVFHSLLGIWNPAQFIVQASGMSVALALNPVRAFKTMSEVIALRFLRYVPDSASPELVNDIYKTASAAMKIPVNELKDLHNGFKGSGLLDGIATNADLEAVAAGDAVSASLFKRVASDPLWFYKEGEFITRAYGWLEARAALKAAGKPLTKEAILKETYRRIINFQRTNKAIWQEGITGVFTQFMQVPFKFTGRFFSKEWTWDEKMRVALFQSGVFGAAAVPLFGDQIAEGVARWVHGIEDPRLIPEDAKRRIRHGLIGAAQQWFGLDEVDLSSRLSMGGDLRFKGAVDVITADTPWYKIPPFFGVADKLATAYQIFHPVISKFQQEQYDVTTFNKQDLEYFLRAVSKLSSTTNNAAKAYLMYNTNKIYSRDGTVLIDKTEEGGFSATELIATALGFPLLDSKDLYEAIKYNADRLEVLRDAVKTLVQMHNEYISDLDTTESTAEMVLLGQKFDKAKAYVKELYSLDGQEIDKVWESYINKINDKKSSYQKNFNQLRKSVETRIRTEDDAQSSEINPLLPLGNETVK